VSNYTTLKNLVLGKKCVAFSGAGLSMPPAENWYNTVKHIAETCGVPYDSGNLYKIIDDCLDANPQRYMTALCKAWPQNVVISRTAMHQLLRLNFKAILTTNFDPWLRQAARSSEYNECYAYPLFPIQKPLDNKIVYVHGCFESDNIAAAVPPLVFGERSFVEAYETSLLPGFLSNVFVSQNVLFIAFDPTEAHIAKILYNSIAMRRNLYASPSFRAEQTSRYLLTETRSFISDEDRIAHETWIEKIRALDIIPVSYDPEGPDHKGLERLFETWINEGAMENRPPPFAEGF